MAKVHIPSFEAADAAYKAHFQEMLAEGKVRRAFIFWDLIPASVPLMYLAFMLPPTLPHRKALQVVLYGIICSISLESYLFCRSDHAAFNYGLGLQPIYVVLWTGIILFLEDPAPTHGRLEYTQQTMPPSTTVSTREKREPENRDQPGPTLHWQGYPSSYWHRFTWFTDFLLNFRLLGWKEQARYLGFGARDIETFSSRARNTSPGDPPVFIVGRAGTRAFFQAAPALRSKLIDLVTSYIVLDVGTWIARKDPFFWALDYVPRSYRSISTMPGPEYLPFVLANSPTYLQAYRITISALMVYAALNALLPIPAIVCLLCSYCPGSGGPWTTVTAPWHWPDEFGSLQPVFDFGLAGGWGGTWHQTFRLMFAAPSKAIFRHTNINPKGVLGRAIQAFFAFGLSGLIHGGTSFIQLTRQKEPNFGAFIFFMMTALGVVIQASVTEICRSAGVNRQLPPRLLGSINFAFALWWTYCTSPLIFEDFARNVWLWHPVPLSPIRFLQGKSLKTPGYLPPFIWVDGGAWWKSGWAI